MTILLDAMQNNIIYALFALVIFAALLFMGKYIVRWYHRTDEIVALLEELVELQKKKNKGDGNN